MIPSLRCIFMHQKPEPVTPVPTPLRGFPLASGSFASVRVVF